MFMALSIGGPFVRAWSLATTIVLNGKERAGDRV
jgi:hypothetical protein